MMRLAGEVALALTSTPAVSLIAKATLVCAGTLIAAHLARRSRASFRHLILAANFALLLAMPLAALVVPAREVAVPVSPADQPTATLIASRPDTALPGPPMARSIDSKVNSPARPLPSTTVLLIIVWLIGATLFLVPMIGGLLRVSRLRRNGVPWRDGQQLLSQIATGRLGRVDVLLDGTIAGPVTCGVVRPAIMLPTDARRWARTDLERAIAHEVEHIRRVDWVTLCVARMACAVYWFHPLVWMAWRRLRLEAERACDDAVLAGGQPEEYADQLVTLAERLASQSAPSLLAMANRDDLSARVRAVLDASQRRGRTGRWGIGVVIGGAVLLLIGVAPIRAVGVMQIENTGSAAERAVAACELARTRNQAAIPALIAMLEDGAPLPPQIFCGTQPPFEDESWSPKYPGVFEPSPGEAAARTLVAIGDAAIEPLIDTLRAAPGWRARKNAAWALGYRGRAATALIAALRDPAWQVRAQAVHSLVPARGSDSAVSVALVSALADPDWHVREQATAALWHTADTRAWHSLFDALADPEESVRAGAARALGNRARDAEVQLLIAARHDADPRVRQGVRDALRIVDQRMRGTTTNLTRIQLPVD